MFDLLAEYASVLAQAGRESDARKALDEAKGVARELKNDALVARTLNIEGDILTYANEWKGAKSIYEQALQTALRGKSREQELVSRLNLERVAMAEGNPRGPINNLAVMAQQADSLGLKYISVLSSAYHAEALVNSKDLSHARPELQRVLSQAEKLGMRWWWKKFITSWVYLYV